MVVLGSATSRLKDFYDLYVLSRLPPFAGDTLTRSIAAIFRRQPQFPKPCGCAYSGVLLKKTVLLSGGPISIETGCLAHQPTLAWLVSGSEYSWETPSAPWLGKQSSMRAGRRKDRGNEQRCGEDNAKNSFQVVFVIQGLRRRVAGGDTGRVGPQALEACS